MFPNCVTERIGKDGKPELAIDFDKLKAELNNDVLEEGEERYQFTWPGKRAALRLANETTIFHHTRNLGCNGQCDRQLRPVFETYSKDTVKKSCNQKG